MTTSADAGRTARQQAIAWLAHPATLAAVIVLAVNDHVLKPEFGTWWTGKLSDVAGLVFAPALLAVAVSLCAPRIRIRTLVPCAIAAVGIGFAVVKTTAAGAAAASAAWTAVAGPSVVLRDPTDLLAIPALAIAWAIARRTVRRATAAAPAETAVPRRRASAVLRWGVVLPLVVLVTAATSRGPAPTATELAVVDGQIMVGRGTQEYEGMSWHRSTDGAYWTQVPWQDEEQRAAAFAAAGGTRTEACVPSTPETCYRAVPGRLAVELSTDGGESWQVDWEVPDRTRDALGERYSTVNDPGDDLRTVGVAVLPTPRGHRVFAANLLDGLAMRDENAEWARIGFAFSGQDSVVPLPELDPEPAWRYPVPWGLPFGAVAATLALLLLGTATRPRRSDRVEFAVRVAVALVQFAFAALCLWNAVAVNLQGAAVPGQGSGSDSVTVAAMLAIGVGFAVGGSAVLEREIRRPAAAAALIGLTVGVVTALVPNHTAVRVIAAAATLVLGLAVAITARRRGEARRAHESDTVSVTPPQGKGTL